MDFEDELKAAGVTPGRAIKWGLIVISVLIVLFIFARVLGLAGTVVGSATGVVNQTLNPSNVITTYERFHDRWKNFEARKAQIASYQVVVDAEDGTTALIEQQAMRQSCRQLAADYNADAAKTNRVIFKGRDAPETLNAQECDQ